MSELPNDPHTGTEQFVFKAIHELLAFNVSAN